MNDSEGETMGYETILFGKKDVVARITLNRPEKMNAMNGVMFREVLQALDDAEKDDKVRVVVITGSGKAFCTGVDLTFAREELDSFRSELDFLSLGKRLLRRMEDLAKPLIAAVNGLALAGGFEMILAVDMVIAAEEAMIGDQHMRVGMFGAGGTPFRLPILIGLRKAKELILTGRWISAKEAERIGLVNRAVPAGELEQAVDEMVAELADKSPTAMRITKSYMNRTALSHAEANLEMAILSSLANTASEDHKEAMRAFREKRKPKFTGR
ncbi:MAG TPA: enoyl-CoA hydratase/isomerase family protein [Desulfobacteraceae bacterium]|nr:enoyl-CoA hydratase/isomerase family protein [Desulfobacteraceae bacterium]